MRKDPSRQQPRVAVVILNWNGWRDTIECLASLHQVEYPDLEVVVVDNASRDDSVGHISYWCDGSGIPCTTSTEMPPLARELCSLAGTERGIRRVVVLALRENSGFCRGNNLGMEQAFRGGADFVLILNNDTIVTPGFLAPMVEAALNDERIGLAGGVICHAERQDTIWFAGVSVDRFLEFRQPLTGKRLQEACLPDIVRTDAVTGCMMLVPRRTHQELGGFDERFFIWSEDWEYSLRARAAGYRLIVVTASRIHHKVSRSLGVMQPLSYYYGTRNRLLLKRMLLPWHLRAVFLTWFLCSRVIRYTQFALQGRWDLVRAGCEGIYDYLRGRTGKWWRQCD